MILELTKQNILNLTNESKRKNILAAWRSWGIWHKAPEIGLSVYRLPTCRMARSLRPAGMRATTSFRAAAWAWAMSTVRVSISATRAAS